MDDSATSKHTVNDGRFLPLLNNLDFWSRLARRKRHGSQQGMYTVNGTTARSKTPWSGYEMDTCAGKIVLRCGEVTSKSENVNFRNQRKHGAGERGARAQAEMFRQPSKISSGGNHPG